MRVLVERTARQAQAIRFDHRGTGLSDHGVPVTLDGWLSDITAVADRIGLKRFVLVSLRGGSAPVAMHYAARYADRFSHLVLADARLRTPPARVEHTADCLQCRTSTGVH